MRNSMAVTVLALAMAGIGLTTAAARDESDERDVIQDGRVERLIRVLGDRHARIGIAVGDLDADAKDPGGARIERMEDDGPAAKAGFRTGDIITEFDGERVRSARQLSRLVSETPVGRNVSVGVLRDGRRVELRVTPEAQDAAFSAVVPGPRPGAPLLRPMPRFRFEGPDSGWLERFHREFEWHDPLGRGTGRLGVAAQPLSTQLAEYFGTEEGVLIATVQSDSPAARAGLRAGDVLTAVDGQRITSTSDLARMMAKAEGPAVTVSYVRNRKSAEVEVALPTRERPAQHTRPV